MQRSSNEFWGAGVSSAWFLACLVLALTGAWYYGGGVRAGISIVIFALVGVACLGYSVYQNLRVGLRLREKEKKFSSKFGFDPTGVYGVLAQLSNRDLVQKVIKNRESGLREFWKEVVDLDLFAEGRRKTEASSKLAVFLVQVRDLEEDIDLAVEYEWYEHPTDPPAKADTPIATSNGKETPQSAPA